MFDEVLRVREVGSVNSDTIVKEIKNPKGLKGGLNLTLNVSRQQTRGVFIRNVMQAQHLLRLVGVAAQAVLHGWGAAGGVNDRRRPADRGRR